MRILITGATGFVGRHLCELVAPEHDVFAVVRPGGEPPSGTSPVEWDMAAAPREVHVPEVDCIVHLAQSRRYRDFPDQAPHIFDVNLSATAHLLHLAGRLAVRRFIYASTGGVYRPSREPLRESSPIAPSGYYAATKYAAEELVRCYRGRFSTALVRLFFVYGGGQRGMLIPRLVQRVYEGKPIQLVGPEGIRLNPVHVQDVARVFLALTRDNDHRVLNLGGKETVSMRRLSGWIGQLLGREPVYESHAAAHDIDLIADTSLLREVLGFSSQVLLEQGLREFVQEFHDSILS